MAVYKANSLIVPRAYVDIWLNDIVVNGIRYAPYIIKILDARDMCLLLIEERDSSGGMKKMIFFNDEEANNFPTEIWSTLFLMCKLIRRKNYGM